MPGGEPTCYVEKAANIHTMYDPKVELSDRIHTFESLGKHYQDKKSCCVIDSNIPDILHVSLNEAIIKIRDTLQKTSNIDLKNGTFYFKVDKNDKLYLVYACGIQAEDRNNPSDLT